jgi:nucleoside-diphosphate-sugar epimerase
METNGFVLVTGSSGLIGSAVSKRLAARHPVVGIDRPGEPHPPEEAEAVECDPARLHRAHGRAPSHVAR